MPAVNPVVPATLDAVAAQLARSSAAALEASHELLDHYADTGDRSTQRTVDTLIDHAAEKLQSLTDSLSEASRRLDADASTLRCDVPVARGDAPVGRRDMSQTRRDVAVARDDVPLTRGDLSQTRPGLRRGRSA